ncbi:PREDICTED: 5-hydroxyisourate hydrolase-like, partial [Hipposideros armiger]|uniref:5-hydroxyisourate hydrolase n=1 Tax=Hipposideros armiger TaxID=186990 RepID=A0A8B7RF82_HIPAR
SAVGCLGCSRAPGPSIIPSQAAGASEAAGCADPESQAEVAPHPLPSPPPRPSYTDPDGRCPGLLPPGQMKAGTYKLFFDTEGYWKKRGQESFYPYVEVVFTITNETHKFHVPLLLTPWSYTTYRGS